MTKRVKINCAPLKTKDDFYTALSTCLGTPEYFGKNLDALHDVLSGMKIVLEMRNFSALRCALGEYADTLETMLKATAEESDNFNVKIRD